MIYICNSDNNNMITYYRFFHGTIRFLIYITYKLESAELSINSFITLESAIVVNPEKIALSYPNI